MPQRLHKSGSGSTMVPRGAVLVCSRIQEIRAQKGNNSNWPHEYFKHKFTKNHGEIYQVKMGVPSGAQLIYNRVESVKGTGFSKTFKSGKIYGLRDGRILIKSPQCSLVVVAPYPLWDKFNYPNQ